MTIGIAVTVSLLLLQDPSIYLSFHFLLFSLDGPLEQQNPHYYYYYYYYSEFFIKALTGRFSLKSESLQVSDRRD